jgi:hypothetical protein
MGVDERLAGRRHKALNEAGHHVFERLERDDNVEILPGRLYPVDPTRVHRLVRAELDLDDLVIRCFALHRRDPGFQPLLAELPYVLPANRAWVARMC